MLVTDPAESSGPPAAPKSLKAADAWTALPVVSADQSTSPSALAPLTAFRWFIEYGGRYGTGWTNRVVFTGSGDAPDLDPFACAPRVRVPTLFAMSPDDEMPGAVSKVSRAVFERLAGPRELVEVDGATSASSNTRATHSSGPVRHRPRG